VGNGFDGTLSRVDQGAHAGTPIRPEPGSIGRLPLAANGSVVWVGSQDGTLAELSRSGKTLAVIRGIGLPESVAADAGSVWVGRATEDAVVRVYVRSHRLRRIPLGDRPSALATGDRAVWVMAKSTLWRIDPRLNAVTAQIALPGQATALAVTPYGVWVGAEDGFLVEIDPTTNKVSRTRLLGRPIDSLAAGAGHLWASVG
jgi:streptogramin lyase